MTADRTWPADETSPYLLRTVFSLSLPNLVLDVIADSA